MIRKIFVISFFGAALSWGCDDNSNQTPGGNQNGQTPGDDNSNQTPGDDNSNQTPGGQNNQSDPTLTECGDYRCDTKKGEQCIEILTSRDMAYDPILDTYVPPP